MRFGSSIFGSLLTLAVLFIPALCYHACRVSNQEQERWHGILYFDPEMNEFVSQKDYEKRYGAEESTNANGGGNNALAEASP